MEVRLNFFFGSFFFVVGLRLGVWWQAVEVLIMPADYLKGCGGLSLSPVGNHTPQVVWQAVGLSCGSVEG
jgi:hypothetical protein